MNPSPSPTRGRRMPRDARRGQLLEAAREVFVAQGYHAAAMDDIAERAGVSKPVLYQHFPGKRELYLALLEQHTQELLAAIEKALSSTSNNKQRVAATIAAYFEFVDSDHAAFRLVFESDLRSDPQVRELMDAGAAGCATAIAAVVREDTGLSAEEADLLGQALAGMAAHTARYWLENGRRLTREQACELSTQLSWRGIRGFPKADSPVP